jgi:hypothetical protein
LGARKEDNGEVKEVGSGWVKRGWNDGQWAKRLTKPRAKKDKMHPMDPEDMYSDWIKKTQSDGSAFSSTPVVYWACYSRRFLPSLSDSFAD